MPYLSRLSKKHQIVIGALIGVIVILIGAWILYPRPVPETTQFASGHFTVTYPRVDEVREYDTGVVSVGDTAGSTFIPLVDVVEYKNDLQSAAPANFDAFMKKQVAQLCGSDASGESITCSNPVVTPFTAESGLSGSEVSLTLTHKNLRTGTTTASTYAPIYVFDTTKPVDQGETKRYSGIFVYPTFSSFILVGTTSPEFVENIASSVTLNK